MMILMVPKPRLYLKFWNRLLLIQMIRNQHGVVHILYVMVDIIHGVNYRHHKKISWMIVMHVIGASILNQLGKMLNEHMGS